MGATTSSWAQALDSYQASVREETESMYQATMNRVKNELYTQHPDWAYRTWLRWLADDREYKRRIALLLGRGIDPVDWLPTSVMLAAIGRGALGDLGRAITRQPRTNAVLST